MRASLGALVVALVVALVAGAGCARDTYTCTSDADCDLGEAGRCELDGRCTAFDATCPTAHRYTPHSEELSGQCFDDRVVPLNACAEGQPPALPVDCFADVCAALPACCEVGWSSACVQQAQLRCELTCTTRIAISATKQAVPELWDLAWTSNGWVPSSSDVVASTLLWIAPAPRSAVPRLAYLMTGSVQIDAETYPLSPLRQYQDLARVDVARDGRDTVVISSIENGAEHLDTLDVESGLVLRENTLGASVRMAWGDANHDGFPDALIASGSRYFLVVNEVAADRGRDLLPRSDSTLSTAMTTGVQQQIRSIEWTDINGDGVLDLSVAGNSVHLHAGDAGSAIDLATPSIDLDCAPPQPSATCVDPSTTAFTTAVVPSTSGAELLVSTLPNRALFVAKLGSGPPTFTPVTLPTCTGCPAIVAFIVRDLDGDRVLDVTAIDANLGVYTRASRQGADFVFSSPVPTVRTNFGQVRVSVTGVVP